MITAHGLARLHCANWDNGACVGALLEIVSVALNKEQRAARVKQAASVTIPKCTPRRRCVLEQIGVRCAYFEECVMPMGRADWPGLQSTAEHDAFAKAVRQYRLDCNVPNPDQRLCPECKTRPLEPRKQLCYVCRDAKEKASQRERNRTWRDKGSLSTES